MDPQRPLALRVVRRFVVAGLYTVAAGILYFICQGVFSGYPQYGTDIMTWVALTLMVVTAGIAWLIDQRRIDEED